MKKLTFIEILEYIAVVVISICSLGFAITVYRQDIVDYE